MSFKNRIGMIQHVVSNLNPADSAAGLNMESAYGYRSRISSFAAVAAAVCDMPEYIATYSYIDFDGGLHGEHSKTMMRSLLYSNIALGGDEKSMKHAAKLYFRAAFKQISANMTA
ncbi:MAG TPA: hypothetical protein C5S50_02460 [Methanosarcinaceae archaeon]|nr:hypothetical protein [Methanosarcinaceae archaeon]